METASKFEILKRLTGQGVLLVGIATFHKRVSNIRICMSMIIRTYPQSLIWRAYTTFMVLVVGLYHVRHFPSHAAPMPLISTIIPLLGLMALTEWAFGFRSGTRLLRCLIAGTFTLTTAWAVLHVLRRLLEDPPLEGGWPSVAAYWTAIFIYIPMCIGLFRHAGDNSGRGG